MAVMTFRSARTFAAAGVLAVTVTACAQSRSGGDTLAPLPISGDTTPPPSATVAASTPTGTTLPASTTAPLELVGDWDGAEYDVGVIHEVGQLGDYRTIDFDRYSYEDPELGVLDASGFTEEPIAYWWTESPFVNVQEQLRTFVLADSVEVLVLSDDGADRACNGTGPAPSPTWVPVGVSYLDQPAATEDIASLTYSADGQVSRIRFTHGCP
jgi:hypothetical protein